MAKKKKSNWDNLEPQKSSAAQFITYVASVGESYEKYELRYENENIWMSQKTLAAVYGVDLRTISYHITKIFSDAELDKDSVIQKYWITAPDGKNYSVNHYNLQVIIALGFKIENEKVKGIVVTGVTEKTPAAALRLQNGDNICAVNDKRVESVEDFYRELDISNKKKYDLSYKSYFTKRRLLMNTPPGKYAWTVKIGERGQFVIPKEARAMLGVKPGDTILVLGDVERGVAIPPKAMMNRYISMIFGELTGEEQEADHE